MIVICALIEKEIGLQAFQNIQVLKGVEYAYLETGRSDDLFQNKQFGGFGEAAVMTLLVKEEEKENVFSALQNLCTLDEVALGEIFISQPALRTSL